VNLVPIFEVRNAAPEWMPICGRGGRGKETFRTVEEGVLQAPQEGRCLPGVERARLEDLVKCSFMLKHVVPVGRAGTVLPNCSGGKKGTFRAGRGTGGRERGREAGKPPETRRDGRRGRRRAALPARYWGGRRAVPWCVLVIARPGSFIPRADGCREPLWDPLSAQLVAVCGGWTRSPVSSSYHVPVPAVGHVGVRGRDRVGGRTNPGRLGSRAGRAACLVEHGRAERCRGGRADANQAEGNAALGAFLVTAASWRDCCLLGGDNNPAARE
jgi:hypothetical protein